MKRVPAQSIPGRPSPTPNWFGREAIRIGALLILTGLLANSDLGAQNGDSIISTNEVQQSEDSTGLDDTSAADDLSTNAVPETNAPATPGPDGRTRRIQRQRRPRTSNGSPSSGPAGTNNIRSPLDYSAFRVVADRNIFDPNRAPRSTRAPAPQRTIDSFSLVGTMSYEKGDFAFFDGSSSDYKKVLKTNDVIAGYKIVTISPELVTVAAGTNQLGLKVGTQMRRGEDGRWERAASPAAYTANSSPSSSTESPSNAADSDIIKKMMQRREKE